jgi:hypothetical protein
MDIYQGDPKLILTEDGSTILYKGGQPVMDQGIENLILISLFTTTGWAGNKLIDDPDKRAGSDFVEAARGPITLSKLNDIRQAAERALKNPALGPVEVTVTNHRADIIQVLVRVSPPGQDVATLIITRNGQNWLSQALNPANERI